MSSISSSGRTRSEESSRKLSEQEKKETENAKRRRAEIKRLETLYKNELKEISDNFDEQVHALKERHQELLNQRDISNNKKIEDVRSAYRESLKNKSEENQLERDQQRQNYKAESIKQREISEKQREYIKEKSAEEVQKRDSQYRAMAVDLHEKSQKTTQDVARKINESHQRELNTLAKGHQDDVENNARMADSVKKNLKQDLHRSEQARKSENERWSNKFVDTVRAKDEQYSDSLESTQNLMNEEIANIRDRYQDTLDRKMADIEIGNQEFKDAVDGRIRSQVRSRDNQIERLNSRLNHEVTANNRLRGLERHALTSAFEKEKDLLADQKNAALQKMGEVNEERIGKVTRDSRRAIHELERENKSNLNIQNVRHRQDREDLELRHKDDLDRTIKMSDGRVRKIQQDSNKTTAHLEKFYEESVEGLKNEQIDRMGVMRDKAVADQTVVRKSLSERFKGIEANFANKMEQTVKKYEDQIAQLKERQEKEINVIENKFKKDNAERDKLSKTEKDNLVIQYESKIAQLNESHQEQIDRINRRHKENMQDLAVKVSSYSRKA